MMFFFNSKKKTLNIIYNKIVKESKDSFFLVQKKPSNIEQLREFFQLNFILILWYMKIKKINNRHLDYLIKIFIKDLEGMIVELGGSETSFRKKVRIIIENFYGRLYAYTDLFDKFENIKNEQIKKIIGRNFAFLTNNKYIIEYVRLNIVSLKKLNVDDFWSTNFNFKSF
tara:strand:+ start:476 stop:985 length:510 start_codon:yes stop_codon:yes gene_type:complete